MASTSTTTTRQSRGRVQPAAPTLSSNVGGNQGNASGAVPRRANLKRTLSSAFLKKLGKVEAGVEKAVEATEQGSRVDDERKRAKKSFREAVMETMSKLKSTNSNKQKSDGATSESLLEKSKKAFRFKNAAPGSQASPSKMRRDEFNRKVSEKMRNSSREEALKIQALVRDELSIYFLRKEAAERAGLCPLYFDFDSLSRKIDALENRPNQKSELPLRKKEETHCPNLNDATNQKTYKNIPDEAARPTNSSALEPLQLEAADEKSSGSQKSTPPLQKELTLQNVKPNEATISRVHSETDEKDYNGDTKETGILDQDNESEIVDVEELNEIPEEFEEILEALQEVTESSESDFEEVIRSTEDFVEIKEALKEFDEMRKAEELMKIIEKLNKTDSPTDWEFLEKEDLKEKKDNVFAVPSSPYKVPIWDGPDMNGWRHIGFVEDMEEAQKTDTN